MTVWFRLSNISWVPGPHYLVNVNPVALPRDGRVQGGLRGRQGGLQPRAQRHEGDGKKLSLTKLLPDDR